MISKAHFRNPRWWTAAVLILLAVGAGLYLNHHFGWLKQVHLHIATYHWLIVFLIIATLPVFGFSIVACGMIAGSKFGGGGGLLVMALATVIHLLGSHWIATSFLRKRIEAFIARKKYKVPHVPEGENASVSLMTAIIPGLPYFARNYLLALSGIPLRIYFWVCLPIYVLRSMLAIFAADFTADLTSHKFGILAAVFVLKVSICAYIFKRLRDKSVRNAKKRSGSSAQDLPV